MEVEKYFQTFTRCAEWRVVWDNSKPTVRDWKVKVVKIKTIDLNGVT